MPVLGENSFGNRKYGFVGRNKNRILVGCTAKILGGKKPKIKVSQKVILTFVQPVSKTTEIAKLPLMLNAFLLSKLEGNCNFSNEKGKKKIVFSPCSVDETVRDTVLWHKKNHKGGFA